MLHNKRMLSRISMLSIQVLVVIALLFNSVATVFAQEAEPSITRKTPSSSSPFSFLKETKLIGNGLLALQEIKTGRSTTQNTINIGQYLSPFALSNDLIFSSLYFPSKLDIPEGSTNQFKELIDFSDCLDDPSGRAIVDNSVSGGKFSGCIVNYSLFPLVKVKILNNHDYWVKIEISDNLDDVGVSKVNVWAEFGYIPGGSNAEYNLTFDENFNSSIYFFMSGGKDLSGNRTIANELNILESFLNAVGIYLEYADFGTMNYIVEALDDQINITTAADQLSNGDLIGFSKSMYKVFDGNEKLTDLIINVGARLGKSISKETILNKITIVRMGFEIKKIITIIYSMATDSYAGIVIFSGKVQSAPIVQKPTPQISPIEIITPTPISNDSSNLISYISLPDGTIVSSGQSLTKTWRMKNTGSTTWGSGYQLVFLRGDRLGAPSSIDIPSTAPGSTVDLSVSLTAPSSTGSYKGFWRLRNPQGTYFGPEIWVIINVKTSSTHITIETDPTSPATTKMVNIHAIANDYPNFRAMRVKIDGEIKGEIGAPEIWVEWNTEEYKNGAHSIVVEVASFADPNWISPETAGISYILEGNTQRTNHTPYPPSLSNPGDWAVFEGTSGINLSASQNGDPDGDNISQYYFEIYESHDTPNSGWISSNTWSPPGLGYYGYQWHVKVRDNYGAESGWSDTRHFNIKNTSPQIYSFTSQTCRDAWGGSEKICFCASTSGGSLNLKLNSASDGSANGTWKIIGGADTTINCNNDSDSPINWSYLEVPSGSYRVRLYQRPNVGGWDNSNIADIVVNVPANLRPGSPDVLLPQLDSYVNSKQVHFEWKTTYRTTDYHLIASTNADYSSPLIDKHFNIGTTSYDYNFPSEFSYVYVKVISTGPHGTNQHTSEFHIDTTPPSSSVTSLSNLTTETKFTVNWGGSDARSGLQWYSIQVKDGNRPDSEWKDWLVDTNTTAGIYEGQAGHTYYFRSKAMDTVGNWEAWSSGNGDTYTTVDPASAPPTPWWNSNYSYKHGLVILNNDNHSLNAHYPIHIQFTASTSPTAAEIYNASTSATKGNDVRVVYNNTTELNRFIQRFTSNQIDIWFPLQGTIGGGGSNNSSYQLYYGNSNSGTPPADINTIFLPVADSNTMGLWHFQEGTGSTVNDSSGRSHNGTFNGSGWVDGQTGWAGLFNGSTSYVDAGNSNDFNLASSPMTIEAWIYMTSRGEHPHLISKWGQDGSYFIRINDGKRIHLLTRSGGEIKTGELLDLNKWYHIAVTYDGSSTMRIFVNGQQHAIQTGVTDGLLTAHKLFIGWAEQGYDGGHFPGYIQHVRISNIARTDFSYGAITVPPSVAVGIRQTQPVVGNADLAILSLNTYPYPEGGIIAEVVVENNGNVSTTNGFYTDLYIDHLPTGAGDYTGSLQFWVSDPIPAGGTSTLTTVLTDLPQLDVASAASAFEEKTGVLYALSDSAGAIAETDKTNNITSTGTEFCIASNDTFESDNSSTDAKLVSIATTHNFNSQVDEDWMKFVASQNTAYNISTSNLGSNADTMLYLYDTDGATLLASNDDFNESLASQITWSAPSNGTYFIQVKQWNQYVSGCGTNYTLNINKAAPPVAPVLLTPAQSSFIPATYKFSWNASNSATGYQFRYDNSSSFNDPIIFTSDLLTDVNYTPLSMEEGIYYWQVRACIGLDYCGPWSAARKFTVDTTKPNNPKITQPTIGGSTFDTTPKLAVSSVRGAKYYEFEIVGTSITYKGTATSFTVPAVQALSYAEDYTWRARAIDAAGNESDWTEGNFILSTQKSPANSAFTTDTTPTFKWYLSPGATAYQLQIMQEDKSTSVYSSQFGKTIFSHTIPSLNALPNGKYFWRVLPYQGGEWISTPYRLLTITPKPLAAPATIAPSAYGYAAKNVYYTNDSTPLFDWADVNEAQKYEFWLDTSTKFAAPRISEIIEGDSQYEVTSNLEDGKYYYKVRTYNYLDVPGPWSAYRTVIIDTAAPTAPNLYKPADQVSAKGTTTFYWRAVTGSKFYQFCLTTPGDSNCEASEKYISPENLTATSHKPPFQEPGTYIWMVKTRDAAVNWSNWSSSRTITIQNTTPPAPVLEAPENGANIEDPTPTFQWQRALYAQRYEILVDTNAKFQAPLTLHEYSADNALEFTPTTDLANGKYYWKVRGISGDGTVGSWSSYRILTISGVAQQSVIQLAAPTELNAQIASNSSIELTWVNNTSDAESIQIERSSGSEENWQILDTISSSQTTYTDNTISCDAAYSYRINISNSIDGQRSDYSNTVQARSSLCTLLPPEKLTLVDSTDTSIHFSWTNQSNDATGILVERSNDVPDTWEEIAITASSITEFTDEALTCNNTYSYRLRAYREIDQSYSEFSPTITTQTNGCSIPFEDDFSTDKGWTNLSDTAIYRDANEQWVVWNVNPDSTNLLYYPISAPGDGVKLTFRYKVTGYSGNGSVAIGLVENLGAPLLAAETNSTGVFVRIFHSGDVNNDSDFWATISAAFKDANVYQPSEGINQPGINEWRKAALTIENGKWALTISNDSDTIIGQQSGDLPAQFSEFNYIYLYSDQTEKGSTQNGLLDDVKIDFYKSDSES